MKAQREVPLSGYVKNQIWDVKLEYPVGLVIFVAVVLVAGAIYLAYAEPVLAVSILLGGMAIGAFLVAWFCARKRKPVLLRVLEENTHDYWRSRKLQEVITAFSRVRSADYPVVEKPVAGPAWRPFRVEHFLSNSLRGQLSGNIELHGFCFIFADLHGTFDGTLQGKTTPNLLDTSTVVFLEGPSGEVQRVLVPSPQATKELFLGAIEAWCSNFPFNCHTRQTLEKFSLADEYLLHPISHPQMIDALDASCQRPLEQRPEVRVIGEKVQDGVVLATALEVNGKSETFLPSGFFRAIAVRIAPLLEQEINPPKTLAAIS